LISDVVSAAAANSALVPTGTCNCVGTLGAILGGGLGNLMGLYGLGVDNLQALNVVTSDGKAITVTPKDADLWWAMRGAGPNFGIVTSAVMSSYPVNADGLQAWLGPLIFTPDKLELVIQAINELHLQPEMVLSMTWVNSGGTPTIIVGVFYYGTAEVGRAAFASIYAAGPVADRTAITPYPSWNNGAQVACTKGGRRPNFGVGLARIDPDTWRAVFNKYAEFIKLPGAGNSTVLLNAYPTAKERSVSDSNSSYPFRNTVKFFAVFSALYTDRSFDPTAVKYGSQVRDLWRRTDGLGQDGTYVFFSFLGPTVSKSTIGY
jgi:FAD binding domain